MSKHKKNQWLLTEDEANYAKSVMKFIKKTNKYSNELMAFRDELLVRHPDVSAEEFDSAFHAYYHVVTDTFDALHKKVSNASEVNSFLNSKKIFVEVNKLRDKE